MRTKFERWSSQAQESTQVRLQERLQELIRGAVGDMTSQISSIAERQCEQALKKTQVEFKERGQSLKEEMLKVVAEASAKHERLIADGSTRIDTALATVNSMSSEIARLDAQDRQQQSQISQEANAREPMEQAIATLRRGLEHQRIHMNEVCDRVV